jgi:predicted ester cyclase
VDVRVVLRPVEVRVCAHFASAAPRADARRAPPRPAQRGENGTVEPWELREWHGEFLEACNRHDLAAVRAFLHPDVRRAHLPGGADAWIEDLAELFHGFPDWQWKRIQLVAEDDRVAVHLRGGGTHTGPYRGRAATRRHVNVAEFAFYRVTRGRIAEVTGSGDAAILAELGH